MSIFEIPSWRVSNTVKEHNIIYEKQSNFQSRDSTNDAIFQSVHRTFNSLQKEQFTIGVFIFLSKPFNTVGWSISYWKKLKLYGITDKNLACFKGYLPNGKQYIEICENSKRDQIYYLQRSPGIYYWNASVFSICNRANKCISAIRSNLIFWWFWSFFNHKDIKRFFTVVIKETLYIKDWFTAKKLSVNGEKAKHSFIHEPIPLCLWKLIFNNYEMRRIYQGPWRFIRPILNFRAQQ